MNLSPQEMAAGGTALAAAGGLLMKWGPGILRFVMRLDNNESKETMTSCKDHPEMCAKLAAIPEIKEMLDQVFTILRKHEGMLGEIRGAILMRGQIKTIGDDDAKA